jgi:hypothetical protein
MEDVHQQQLGSELRGAAWRKAVVSSQQAVGSGEKKESNSKFQIRNCPSLPPRLFN